MTDTGSKRAYLLVAAVLATFVGLWVLSFTDLEWRGLIGWGLVLLGLVFNIIRSGMTRRSATDDRR